MAHLPHMRCIESTLSKYAADIPGSNAPGPAQILNHLFLGSFKDAKNADHLTSLGVTHLLNCTAIYTGDRMMPIGLRSYLQLGAFDNETYDMLAHLKDAENFITEAQQHGGKVLVYCAKGMNRSAAICVAYLISTKKFPLSKAVDLVAKMRGVILSNSGFRRQLVDLATARNLLGSDPE